MKKRLVFDQRTTTLLGPSSKLFESLKDIQDRGYKVDLILKDWSLELKTKSNKPLLWDPNLHPKDIILNLIKPTFNNIRFVEKENSYKEKLRILVPPFRIFSQIAATIFYDDASILEYILLSQVILRPVNHVMNVLI